MNSTTSSKDNSETLTKPSSSSRTPIEKWIIYFDGHDFSVKKENISAQLKFKHQSNLVRGERLATKYDILGKPTSNLPSQMVGIRKNPTRKGLKKKRKDEYDSDEEMRALEMINKQLANFKSTLDKSIIFTNEEMISKENSKLWPSCKDNCRLFATSKQLLNIEIIQKEQQERIELIKAQEEEKMQIQEEEHQWKKRTRFSNFASTVRDRHDKIERTIFKRCKPSTLNSETDGEVSELSSDEEENEALKSCVVTFDSLLEYAKEAKLRAAEKYAEEMKNGIPLYDL